jgi:site-specific DNA-methyltransferase (cytosine-N4-specific)
VTSPPYWGLRSYLAKGHPLKAREIGSEPTFELYLEHLLEVFDQVRRVLREDGTLFVNLGDAYYQARKGNSGPMQDHFKQATNVGSWDTRRNDVGTISPLRTGGVPWLKCKDLVMMPARVAMALQASGWYLRAMIPWIKRNAMPESVKDRPTTAVEYVFMFSKSERYFWDRTAVMMKSSDKTHARRARNGTFKGNRVPDETLRGVNPKALLSERGTKQNASFAAGCGQYVVGERNRRNSDWFMESFQGLLLDEEGDPLGLIVNTKGTSVRHFATFPAKMVEPLIKAGSPADGTVLDPFGGISTVARVAVALGRKAIVSELNPEYAAV